jgi:hypothetical protein
MRLLLLLPVAIVVLTAPTSARATDLRFPDGRVAQPYQRWVDASPAPGPPGRYTINERPCFDRADANGCFYNRSIWLEPKVMPRRFPWLVFHELGHAFDAADMTPAARQAFAAINGRWEQEDFADAYAACATRSAVRVRRVCSLLVRQARRN